MLRSLIPFVLASLGFTLIGLTIVMPLFEWQISEIDTGLPHEFQINPVWTAKPGESLADDSYILRQVVIQENGYDCSPGELIYVARRSPGDERVEQIALDVYEKTTQWLTGLNLTGQITMASVLLLCGIYILWFTIWYNRPFSETIISTTVAVLLLAFLINVWRILTPITGNFSCRPEVHGAVSFDAKLSKVHYETLLVLLFGISAEVVALGIIVRQMIKAATKSKEAS
jgi:hypothetical protein